MTEKPLGLKILYFWQCPICKRCYGARSLCCICHIPTELKRMPSVGEEILLRTTHTISSNPKLLEAAFGVLGGILKRIL